MPIMNKIRDQNTQHHDGTGHQMQSTSRLAPLDFHGSTATSAHLQVLKTNNKVNLKNIGTFNAQGLLSKTKQMLLADDFYKYNLQALMLQETHMKGNGVLDIKSTTGKTVRLYYSGHKERSSQGVGILVEPTTDCDFTPISSRLMMLTIKNETIQTNLVSAYAPTNKRTIKNPEKTAQFYNNLTSIVNKVKKKEALVIGGDFNAKTKQDTKEKSNSTGKYTKSNINENGELLIEFADMNNLKLTNTFFKHKPAHLSTWQCPQRQQEIMDKNSGTIRRNPYRNQIDYILIRKSNNITVHDSRSFGGFTCNSDHKPVISKINLRWKKTIRTKPRPRINYQGINQSNTSRKDYQNLVKDNLAKMDKTNNVQTKWDNIKKCTINAAIKVAGYNTRNNHHRNNKQIEELSKKQKQLHNEITSTRCKNKQKTLKAERNQILNKIHKEIKKEENNKISDKLKPIENMPDDANKTYRAVKHLKRMKQKTKLLIKTKNGLTANQERQTELITEYYQNQFFKEAEKIPAKSPCKMREPFTPKEIKEAAYSMKNNTSPYNNVTIEMIKYGPEEIFDEIAKIFNQAAETGNCPKELTEGIITPLQKPNKAKGPIANLRPITLLSILRKILATCLCRRTNKRIDKEIPIEQAAYRTGRSTTEHVLATKLVIERTLTSENEEVHLLLLDMSKAFDTMERKTLINDLELILEPDEIFLFCKLLDIKLAVKCGSTLGNLFETDTGGPQGDCSSAKNFTFYLAKTLKPDQTESQNQTAQDQQGITLEQQYADDISKITTNRQEIEKTLEEYPIKLENRGLIINEDKTELYTISKTSDESWKKCKLLGTYLDTKEDIKRRKSLAIQSAKNLKPLFNNKKIWTTTKSRAFDTYITSVFLYNACTWTLTATQEKQLDAFQRKMLRINVLNVKWPKKISSEKVYRISKVKPWSKRVQKQRLTWFGHLCRLHPDVPAKKALKYAKENYKKTRGRPRLKWINLMEKQLNDCLNLTWEEAETAAQDRRVWRQLVNRATS